MEGEITVTQFVDRIQRNEITFDQVRKELEARGVEEAEIRSLVRQVDDELRVQLESGSARQSFKRLMQVGYFVTAIGLILTLASLAGYFRTAGGYLVFIAYGPLLAGLSLIFAARRGMARTNGRRPLQEKRKRRDNGNH